MTIKEVLEAVSIDFMNQCEICEEEYDSMWGNPYVCPKCVNESHYEE